MKKYLNNTFKLQNSIFIFKKPVHISLNSFQSIRIGTYTQTIQIDRLKEYAILRWQIQLNFPEIFQADLMETM